MQDLILVDQEPCVVDIRSEVRDCRYVVERVFSTAEGPRRDPVRVFAWGGLVTRYQAWCAAFDLAHKLASAPNARIGDLDGGRGWGRI